MDNKCSECGMTGFHKMDCSQQYKSRDALKANWEKLKEMQYYKFKGNLS